MVEVVGFWAPSPTELVLLLLLASITGAWILTGILNALEKGKKEK